jgi:hypothetical protein
LKAAVAKKRVANHYTRPHLRIFPFAQTHLRQAVETLRAAMNGKGGAWISFAKIPLQDPITSTQYDAL